MKHERQVELLKEVFAHIDAGTTPMADAPYWNPAERYTSDDHFRLEMERVFGGQVPLLAGFSPELPAPGKVFRDDGVESSIGLDQYGEQCDCLRFTWCPEAGKWGSAGAGYYRRWGSDPLGEGGFAALDPSWRADFNPPMPQT